MKYQSTLAWKNDEVGSADTFYLRDLNGKWKCLIISEAETKISITGKVKKIDNITYIEFTVYDSKSKFTCKVYSPLKEIKR